MRMQAEGKAVMVLHIEIDPADEAEFNTWYDTEHLPEVCALPDILSAQRFRVVDQPGHYLTIYELAAPGAVTSEAYLAWRANSVSTATMAERFKSFTRIVGAQIMRYPGEKPSGSN